MNQLVAHPDFGTIYSVSRRPLGIVSEKVTEIIIDFDGLPENLAGLTVDCAFCCLGTTLKTAGSKERQYIIDHNYVVHFAQACKAMNVPVFAVVSSIGAAAASRNFYLRTKGEMERDCALLSFPKTIIVRPSFLLGKRREFRLVEKISLPVIKVLSFVMVGPLKKYRGIRVERIAERMIREALSTQKQGLRIFESHEI